MPLDLGLLSSVRRNGGNCWPSWPVAVGRTPSLPSGQPSRERGGQESLGNQIWTPRDEVRPTYNFERSTTWSGSPISHALSSFPKEIFLRRLSFAVLIMNLRTLFLRWIPQRCWRHLPTLPIYGTRSRGELPTTLLLH